jgi:glutathione peroxidase
VAVTARQIAAQSSHRITLIFLHLRAAAKLGRTRAKRRLVSIGRFRSNHPVSDNIYVFEVETITGERESMDKYRGQVLLIVNTASK